MSALACQYVQEVSDGDVADTAAGNHTGIYNHRGVILVSYEPGYGRYTACGVGHVDQNQVGKVAVLLMELLKIRHDQQQQLQLEVSV